MYCVTRRSANPSPHRACRTLRCCLNSTHSLARDHLGDGELKEGLLTASATVEMHRIHRHNFAHWIARRVKGVDAIVMFSMNAREAQRRDGVPLDTHEAKYGILPLDGFAAEVEKLKAHANYLARTAAELERNVDKLRDAIAAARAV